MHTTEFTTSLFAIVTPYKRIKVKLIFQQCHGRMHDDLTDPDVKRMKINHRLCQRSRWCCSRCHGNALSPWPLWSAGWCPFIYLAPGRAARWQNDGGFAPGGRHNCWGISVTTDVSTSNWMIDGGCRRRRRSWGRDAATTVSIVSLYSVRTIIFRLSPGRLNCQQQQRRYSQPSQYWCSESQCHHYRRPRHCQLRSVAPAQ